VFVGLAYAESKVTMAAITRSPGRGAGASVCSLGIEAWDDCWGGATGIPIGAKRFSGFHGSYAGPLLMAGRFLSFEPRWLAMGNRSPSPTFSVSSPLETIRSIRAGYVAHRSRCAGHPSRRSRLPNWDELRRQRKAFQHRWKSLCGSNP
jgi:hypothetical protein